MCVSLSLTHTQIHLCVSVSLSLSLSHTHYHAAEGGVCERVSVFEASPLPFLLRFLIYFSFLFPQHTRVGLPPLFYSVKEIECVLLERFVLLLLWRLRPKYISCSLIFVTTRTSQKNFPSSLKHTEFILSGTFVLPFLRRLRPTITSFSFSFSNTQTSQFFFPSPLKHTECILFEKIVVLLLQRWRTIIISFSFFLWEILLCIFPWLSQICNWNSVLRCGHVVNMCLCVCVCVCVFVHFHLAVSDL